MSAESKRLSKEELREDEFVEWVVRAAEYVRQRAQFFAAGAIGVVVVLLAINYFIDSQQGAKEEAAALLGDMMMAEQSGQIAEALRIGEQLLNQYAGTPAAGQGAVLLGNLHYAQGNYEEARRHFDLYLSDYEPVDVLAYAAQNGLAACLEAQGQVAEAARRYEEMAQRHAGTAQAAMAQMNAARCYGLLGDRARQRQLLENVRDQYAHLPIAARARGQLEML